MTAITASPTTTGLRLRNSTGLVITVVLHAGVAAVALFVITVADRPRPPAPPLVTEAIPAPHTAPAPVAPVTTDIPITVELAPPIVPTDDATPPDRKVGLPLEPPVVSGDGGGQPVDNDTRPLPPTGPTSPARFDPRYVRDLQPPYPLAALRLQEEGAVVVHVSIGADGRVVAARLAGSSGSPRLDAAAVAHALAHWRFTPALKDGVAVVTERDITIRFRLADAGR